jgi:hypothetical protein
MRLVNGAMPILGALILGAWSAGAQPTPGVQNMPDPQQLRIRLQEMLTNGNGKIIGMEGGVMGASVKGAPYSADEIHEVTQTLSDGTRIHNETKVSVSRDSEGRIRRETPTSIEIWDAAAGASYVLDPKNLTYRKMEVHTVIRHGDGAAQTSGYVFTMGAAAGGVMTGEKSPFPLALSMTLPELTGQPKSIEGKGKKETLDARMIEGVNCEGERYTTTIEAGAIGNDRPISAVSERWYSPDLQVTVLSTKSDPRTGTEELRLTNVRRLEPDPSLFKVPDNYQTPGPVKF